MYGFVEHVSAECLERGVDKVLLHELVPERSEEGRGCRA